MSGENKVYAACPFYRSDKATEILCEGIFGARYSKIIFKNKKDKMIYFISHCEKCYKDCEIYKAVILKYDR